MTKRTIEVTFHSAFHHGSGYGLAGVVDRAVLRDSRGTPFLSGAALKGKLRHAALRVLLAREEPACPYADDEGAVCKGPDRCLLCRLFGSPLFSGRLIFGDAYPAGESKAVIEALSVRKEGIYHRDSSIRFGIGMSRSTGRVAPQLLFSSETLPESLVFSAPLYGDLAAEEEEIIDGACRVLTHFGAGGSRGLGQCTFAVRKAEDREVGA